MMIDIRIDNENETFQMSLMHQIAQKAQKGLNIILKNIPKNAEISLRLTDRDEIHRLNRIYRHIDKPTNSLSFPNPNSVATLPSDAPYLLGDIILSQEVICEEAKRQNKSSQDHMTHLIIHGILHLLGYHHENEEEAKNMEHIEIAALAALKISNPYIHETHDVAIEGENEI